MSTPSLIFFNKRLLHHFALVKTWESGLVLSGPIVKMILNGQFDISRAYVTFTTKNELFLTNVQFVQNQTNPFPKKINNLKLLLNKVEIFAIKKHQTEKGLTVIPVKLYWQHHRIKVQIALAKGLKKHSKKQRLIDKDLKKQNQHLAKHFDL